MFNHKRGYICGPLTELPAEIQETVKSFYSKIADVCEKATGVRAFVPHEHYDPIKNANFTPADVDEAERRQVCQRTNILIVVASFGPSWGGGIEVEMANESGVPVALLCERQKLEQRKISRLLIGNPGVIKVIAYGTEEESLREVGKIAAEVAAKREIAIGSFDGTF